MSDLTSDSSLPDRAAYRRKLRIEWRLHVLVIEDDPADASLIRDILTSHPDVAEVSVFAYPDDALDELEHGRLFPDLILLDVHMPRMDGFEFLQRLRIIPDTIDVAAVFVTSSDLGRDIVEGGRSSALGYVIKPDSQLKLQTQLEEVIVRITTGEWPKSE